MTLTQEIAVKRAMILAEMKADHKTTLAYWCEIAE